MNDTLCFGSRNTGLGVSQTCKPRVKTLSGARRIQVCCSRAQYSKSGISLAPTRGCPPHHSRKRLCLKPHPPGFRSLSTAEGCRDVTVQGCDPCHCCLELPARPPNGTLDCRLSRLSTSTPRTSSLSFIFHHNFSVNSIIVPLHFTRIAGFEATIDLEFDSLSTSYLIYCEVDSNRPGIRHSA